MHDCCLNFILTGDLVMAIAVYCLAPSEAAAIRIANRLYSSGFAASDISMVQPNLTGAREIGHTNTTKAPEGAAAGASAGALLGGALGWAAGIGALAIPGLGPLIAAGPIMATLSGLAAGGTVGGLTGALVGTGIPEYEAQQYEGRLREGHILLAVHARDSEEASRVREVMTQEKGESISTGSEVTESKTPVTRRETAKR
jgi:hypothetical protein